MKCSVYCVEVLSCFSNWSTSPPITEFVAYQWHCESTWVSSDMSHKHRAVLCVQVWCCRQAVPLHPPDMETADGQSKWCKGTYTRVLLFPRVPEEYERVKLWMWWLWSFGVQTMSSVLCIKHLCMWCWQLWPRTSPRNKGACEWCDTAKMGQQSRGLYLQAQESSCKWSILL